jgi:hypothetical protein
MEKITYGPLIDHIKYQEEYYNQLYREYEMRFSAIDGKLIVSWTVHTIEPIVKETAIHAPEKLPFVFKTLYTELLELLGNQSSIIYGHEYAEAWKLGMKVPSLVATYPARVIKAINSALKSLRVHQPEKVEKWISYMQSTIGECSTLEEFLSLGRIHAWLCGMAHLRARAKEEFTRLRPELKEHLNKAAAIEGGIEKAFAEVWPDVKDLKFVGQTGGFVGYGYPFSAPPLLAEVNDEILVTDTKSTFAFFADVFGKVIVTDIPVLPQAILKNCLKNSPDSLQIKVKDKQISLPFQDITSIVYKNTTLVLTRASSHYLFVYACPV